MTWIEPSMDELHRLIGPTPTEQVVLCVWGALLLVFAVHILHDLEDKKRWIDDRALGFVHLVMVVAPFIVCKPTPSSGLIPQGFTLKVIYYLFSAWTLYHNMYRLGKYTNTTDTFKKLGEVGNLLPSEKQDLTLTERLKELVPLMVLECIAVVLYTFFFSFFQPFMTYLLVISNGIWIVMISYDIHVRMKKAENKV